MPLLSVHMSIVQEVLEKLPLDNNLGPALLGSTAPDRRVMTGQERSETHYFELKKDIEAKYKSERQAAKDGVDEKKKLYVEERTNKKQEIGTLQEKIGKSDFFSEVLCQFVRLFFVLTRFARYER